MSTGDIIGRDRGERIISTGSCPWSTCGNHTYVPESQYNLLRETGERFHCLAGHGISFPPRPKVDAQAKRTRDAEAAAAEARAQAKAARREAELAARRCPWPTCEGRLLASPRGLRQHMVQAHGAPWAMPQVTGDEVAQVLNGRDPADVVS